MGIFPMAYLIMVDLFLLMFPPSPQESTKEHILSQQPTAAFLPNKFNVAVLGAAGGIGQPLSLLLKL